MVGLGGSKSLISKLETSLVVDLLTVGVLLFDAYVIYNSIGYGADLTAIGSSVEALAVQLTLAVAALYALEMVFDKVKGGGSSLYG